MRTRYGSWRGLSALLLLLSLASMAFAVSDADIAYIKGKIETRQAFTQADFDLAQEINRTSGSWIDLEVAKQLLYGLPLAEEVRQERNPLDVYVMSEVEYEWIDVLEDAQPTGLANDDQNLGPFEIGFSFPFYGATYTQFRVCSNGYVTFGSTSTIYTNTAIPASGEPNGAVYGIWDDLYLPFTPDDADSVYYFADAANQRLVVTWDSIGHIGATTERYTFQIVLTPNGDIRLNYKLVAEGGTYGNTSCTAGIENAAGTEALQICFNGAGTLPVTESSFLISQPNGVPNPPTNVTASPGQTTVTFAWDDPTHDTNGNPLTPDGIQIWMGPVDTGTLIATVGAGTETYTATGLASGNYTFNLRAVEGEFVSAAVPVTAVVGNPSYFADFEADDGQLVADAGWAWGTPSGAGPGGAHSGTHCWGTVLDGNYPSLSCFNLDLNQELVVGSTEATMEFWMWRDCEGFFDGMNVKVSTDGGATWTIVTTATPAYDEDAFYTSTPCIANEVGWTGHTGNTWTYYVVNFGDFVGTTPIIRFNFASDGSVEYPGFYIDDLTLWGFGEPEFASVSGHVTLDGGAGTMTSVQVRANGIGSPVTNPAANGNYTLPQVLVGNRVITGSLVGYHDGVANINLASGGATNVNVTLVRLDPPVPTGLTGSVNNATGVVTLDWDNSTDALVDVYPVYRRLSTEENWTLAGTPSASNFTETLTVDGIYLYAVAARDNGVSTPVESDMSPTITLLYGELPVTSIGTNGNFDDRIQLSWLEPGITEGELISYDDGTSEIWYRVGTPNGPNDYFCQRMSPPDDAAYPLMLYAATVYMERSDPLPWVALCPPNASNAGADIDNPLYVWENIGADSTPGWLYAETDGSVFLDAPGDFYIVIQFPPGGTGPGCGSDNSAPDSRTYWANAYPTWNSFFAWDWMMRAWIGGPPPEGLLGGREQVIEIHADGTPTGYAMDRIPQWTTVNPVFSSKNDKANLTARTEWETEHSLNRWFDGSLQPFSRAPEVTCTISRERGRSLDDLTHYRIYRQGTGQIAQVGATVTQYQDLNRVENTPYTYWVTAVYDGSAESPESQHVTATCNMRPASPTDLEANPMGNTQMVINWVAPTTNADGTNLVDLAGYRIYRDGTQIGTTAPGVTTYTDTPPEPNFFYTWTVAAVDEVPNISDQSAGVIGAVVSPWEVVDYDWVDIAGIGTPAGITGDDQNAGPFDLGFTFTYYGTDYNSVRMCSNGWASFTSTSTAYFNGTIPNAAEPNNAMFIWWDDLYPPDGGEFYYYSDAAEGRFIMSWVNVPHISNDAALYTFQIIIEASGGIIYNYQAVPTETPGVTSGTIGVENADGSDAIELLYNGAGTFTPANETAVAFWAGPSGSIAGLVRQFGNNAPIQGAEVSVEELPGEMTTTDAQGNYSLGVEPGTYTLLIHKQGYCDVIIEDVVVDDGGTTTRNASMRQPNATFSVSTVNILTQVGQNAQGQFEITNPAATCEVVYSITTNQPWLTVNPATGEVNENQSQIITVTGATSAFAPGDYNATITVNHNDTNNPYTIPVTITVSLDADDNTAIPTEFALKTNYPNPFNATTALRFDVPAESRVQITLYNVAGQEVARPVDQVMAAGSHSVLYDAGNLPTGMYLVKMTAGEFSAVQKMLLLK